MNRLNALGNGCRTVLVVEDNADDSMLLQIAAKESCPEVGFQFVRDGFQALAYLMGEGKFGKRQAHPFPNVILLDVRLPGMGGFEVLERIRRLRECDGAKVLAWSDGSDPRIGERAKAAGVEYFIPKPFSFSKLLEETRRICALARETTG